MRCRGPAPIPEISLLRELFIYDPELGRLRWKKKVAIRVNVGDIAGTWSGQRRRCVGIEGRIYLEHRVIFAFIHGKWPDGQIDHVDGDPTNNHVENLRIATGSQNQANSRLRKCNKSGFKGVYWAPDRGKWRAQLRVNGKRLNLGQHSTAEAAHLAYAEAAKEHYGAFARPETQNQQQ